jgi:hypothetical protein
MASSRVSFHRKTRTIRPGGSRQSLPTHPACDLDDMIRVHGVWSYDGRVYDTKLWWDGDDGGQDLL